MSPRLAVLNKKGKIKELIYIEFEAPSAHCDRINMSYSWSTMFCENTYSVLHWFHFEIRT
jgi:hypothetical protein